MCGRYALYGPRKRTRAAEAYFSHVDQFPNSWNVAPTHVLPVARLRDSNVEQLTARWGLVPSWSKEEKNKYPTHNARCETVATLASYKGPYARKQRCLVPAAGFYEWQVLPNGKKQPFHMVGADCQWEPKFPQLWESKIPHPVHASASSVRTRPAFNFSFSRYELPRMFSVTA